ncbi:MAG: hypothetical protein H6601_06230 [Flavobacteriales bacterium]|nr:hypothetical protein [Flavobacteriales bacterium]
MRNKAIQAFLFLFLSVFVFNQVADYVYHHKKESETFVFEMNEVEELNELNSRLKSFEPSDLLFINLHLDAFRNLFAVSDSSCWNGVGLRLFFPHALHLPIYLQKRVILV